MRERGGGSGYPAGGERLIAGAASVVYRGAVWFFHTKATCHITRWSAADLTPILPCYHLRHRYQASDRMRSVLRRRVYGLSLLPCFSYSCRSLRSSPRCPRALMRTRTESRPIPRALRGPTATISTPLAVHMRLLLRTIAPGTLRMFCSRRREPRCQNIGLRSRPTQ